MCKSNSCLSVEEFYCFVRPSLLPYLRNKYIRIESALSDQSSIIDNVIEPYTHRQLRSVVKGQEDCELTNHVSFAILKEIIAKRN